jgi:hypothetical protein
MRAWLHRCEIAWRKCPTDAAAVALETAMKKEHLPPPARRRLQITINFGGE